VTLFDEHAVVLVTGISAAGKSTIADLLARRFARGVHVRGDLFRRMTVSGRADMTADPSKEAIRQLRLRYELAAMVTDTYFDAGFSVVVQDIVLGHDLTRYVETIRGRPLYVFVLAPRPDVVARREEERTKTAYRDVSIEQLDDALRNDTPRIGLWLDNSELSPDETVAEIARRADEAIFGP
jgi:adenylylsulfate kinase-like enzyme